MNREGWQERVIEEKEELDAKLAEFKASLGSSVEDITLLQKQADTMTRYSAILAKRISLFKED